MSSLDPALMDLARSQQSMVTTAQLTVAGLSPSDLVALTRQGVLRHPGRGLSAVAALSSDDPSEWHRQLVAGALLLYPDAIITGVSAALAHRLPVWGAAIRRPQLLRPRDRSAGMSAFHIRSARGRSTVVQSDWGPCVPLADAIAQLAIDHGIVPGVVTADAAINAGAVSDEDLALAVERVKGWPWSNRAAAMRTLVDGRRESVGESRSAVTMAFAGIDLIPQVTIRDSAGDFVARVDFLVRGTKVVIEFDGRLTYDGDGGTALFEEKKREDRLRSLGYVVVRLIWSDLERPGLAVAKVRRALRAA
jgi:hypothetical protein